MRDEKSLTFIHCGSYKDRPSHADNLHLDLWYEGENIMRDAGTYKYNTEAELVQYFNGTGAHNTVTIGDFFQMKKGPRFIWLHWTKAKAAKIFQTNEHFEFEGSVKAFKELGEDIIHTRKIIKIKEIGDWTIEDFVQHETKLPIKQIWNPSPTFFEKFTIEAIDEYNNKIEATYFDAWYSSYYGKKDSVKSILFESYSKKIKTRILKK